jgi:hypothetical protein
MSESEDTLAVAIKLRPDERKALDSWRRSFENPPSRSRAAHTLVMQALSGREHESRAG